MAAEKGPGGACKYVFEMYGEEHRCTHPAHDSDGRCIFHGKDVEAKKDGFRAALDGYMAAVEKDDNVKFYNFRGFVFPAVVFRERKFLKPASFSSASFSGDADFRSASFSGYADFRSASFSGYADFRSASFSGDANFNFASFGGAADFSSASFGGAASFSSANFSWPADFNSASFSGDAGFICASFGGDASFSSASFGGAADFMFANFSRDANFRSAEFKGHAFMSQARFHGLTSFTDANLRLIHTPPPEGAPDEGSTGLNLDGAVIEEAYMWNVPRIEGYSFRDAFLLSFSLAEREVIGCDFTGAVMDAVRTRGWRPDARTLATTKYIYTDYTVEPETDPETGAERKVYKRVEESRVPASGEFGMGENEGFTVADYLRERYKWSQSVNVPHHYRTAVVNYIQFFTEFMKISQGLDMDLITRKEGNRLRVEFYTDTREDKELATSLFKEYLERTKDESYEDLKIEDIGISERSAASEAERIMLVLDLKDKIRSLHKDIERKNDMITMLEDKIKDKEQIAYLKGENEAMRRFMANPTGMLSHTVNRREILFVAKGDIKGFTDYMKAKRADDVNAILRKKIGAAAHDCRYHKVEGGDSLLILHDEPDEIVKAAMRVIEDLVDSTEAPKLRIGLEFGLVGYEEEDGKITRLSSNEMAIWGAARLEPLTRPVEVWCTEAAAGQINACSKKYEAVPLAAEDAPGLEFNNGRFNVKKDSSPEQGIWVALHRILPKGR